MTARSEDRGVQVEARCTCKVRFTDPIMFEDPMVVRVPDCAVHTDLVTLTDGGAR